MSIIAQAKEMHEHDVNINPRLQLIRGFGNCVIGVNDALLISQTRDVRHSAFLSKRATADLPRKCPAETRNAAILYGVRPSSRRPGCYGPRYLEAPGAKLNGRKKRSLDSNPYHQALK